ncbi:RES family NAD+ phosphorylase [Roseateles sp. SL47]|uniref:RES family NAD+ phosphorylase n=1 Tax=Roseateles sp. SL47 TaxID=2995138 RepID=UPI00226F9EC9|nr:RES family NAD+ phosphorylase [Roseateles sp. SL47]WAC75867.1 RES family NAD+ phosphorylase [Roseateles sp. SL47]
MPDAYSGAQKCAKEIRASGAYGLLYRSVRKKGEECVAVFRPKASQIPVIQGAHVTRVWDGTKIESWFEKSQLKPL